MKRITHTRLAFRAAATLLLAAGVPAAVLAATPNVNSAVVKTRIFNDCPTSTVATTNDYPSSISIDDAELDCFGFANLHNWRFSENGADAAQFSNDSEFRFSADLVISGTGDGEAGLQISPWWSPDVDGRLNVRTTDGEIACFGGRLPFYTFTGAHGLRYVKGEPIHLEIVYQPNELSMASPGTIVYNVRFRDVAYTSGPLPFDQGNPAEDPPHGLWGILTPAYAGGHLQVFMRPGDPTANARAVFSDIQFSSCPKPVPVSFDLDPNTLNLRSMGRWVTGVIEPEPPGDPADIDVGSILLNGVVPVDPAGPTSIGDADGDGRPDLTVKFSRAAVQLAVAEGDAVPVTVTGRIGDGCFEATDVIRVKRTPVTAPAAGSVLAAGSTTAVRWETPAGVRVESVAILSSVDDGWTWTLDASGLPNTGASDWTVPAVATERARVAVVLVESADETGYVVTGVLGVSARFTIAAPLGIGPGAGIGFALHGAVPNPARGLSVSFSLASRAPARLEVFDVTGRQVGAREVGSLGPGAHTVSLGRAGDLPAGVYLVQLIQGAQRLSARAVVIQ